MMNLLFIFVAFGWFCLLNHFTTKKYLPSNILKVFGLLSRKINKETHVDKSKPEEIETLSNMNSKQINNEEVDIVSKLASLNIIAFIIMFFLIFFSYVFILISVAF